VQGVDESNRVNKLYLVPSSGASQLVGDNLSMGANQPRMSGNGQTVIYKSYNWWSPSDENICTEQQSCLFSWNKSTNERTELDFLRYYSVNSDGSMIVGFEEIRYPPMVWDASQGTRYLIDALGSIGLDLTGWSDFQSLTISDDGTKIAGFADNSAGQKRAFLIDIIPECPVF
jgi:hypothetical protein